MPQLGPVDLATLLTCLVVVACDSTTTDVPPAGQPETPAAVAPAKAPDAPPRKQGHFNTSDTVHTTIEGKGEGPYRFTAHWFLGQLDMWREHVLPRKGQAGLQYLEIGVFEGRSLLWMVENVLTAPDSHATAIDIFMDEYEATFDANLAASGAVDRITKIKGPSGVELRKLPPASMDIIYIDGSHTAADVLADAVLSWTILKPGGLLIFDDYAWNGRDDTPLPLELLPRVAIDVFVTAHRGELKLVHRGYQIIVEKRDNPCTVKDYCTPVGDYTYHWRDYELRNRDGTRVEISEAERKLLENVLRSRPVGATELEVRKDLVATPEFAALRDRLGLPF